MHSAKRLVNMSTHARRHQSASARVGMFASRCPFSQLSKNQVLLHLERSDWFCIIPCGRLRRASRLPFELSLFGASPRYYGLVRLLASLSRLRGLPSSCQNFRHASPGSTPSAPCVLCRSQTHGIGFIQSERLASGSRPSRGFDTRFTCVGTHVFVR